MAIYHFSVNVVSRARGQSVVAAAAYRAGAALRDERYGITHNYLGKHGVDHAEILAPDDAPPWVHDRQALWNAVEAHERRCDAQLARIVEISLPGELTHSQRLALLRDYVTHEFVAAGMVADVCVRTGGQPLALALLTLRRATPTGFGPKERRWNGKPQLLEWRAAWAETANEHLARAGHAVRIDHRTLAAQQVELAPARHVGRARAARATSAMPEHFAARLAEQARIAHDNGALMLQDPSVALQALAHQRPTFTRAELERFLRTRTLGAAQFDAVLEAVMRCAELVPLPDAAGTARFTTRDMLEAHQSLLRRTRSMLARRGPAVAPAGSAAALGVAEHRAFDYLVGDGDVKAAVFGDADAKSRVLAAAHAAWANAGMAVAGIAPSRRGALSLERASGIKSRSMADCEAAWREEPARERRAVLVFDGADIVVLKQLERILAVADRARAKAVLIGAADAAPGAGPLDAPFGALLRAVQAPGA